MNTNQLLLPQREHAVRGLNSLYLNGVFADMSETGCGKTYVASWIAKTLNVPIVVVCPKVVRRTWDTVLANFGIKANVLINFEKLMRGNTTHLTFKNNRDDGPQDYQLHFPKDCLIIVDEVHKCKGWNSKNSDFLIACKQQNFKLLLLSATAATNPLEMKSFGFATLLHNLSDFRGFLMNAGAYTSRFGGYQIDLGCDKTQRAMQSMHNDLFKTMECAGRMTRKSFGNIFPDNRVSAECVDFGTNTTKIQRVYELMESELAQLEQQSAGYKEHQFAIMTKARRLAELLKVPIMVDMMEDLFDEGISPVVFVNYTETVEAIRNKLLKNAKLAAHMCFIVGGQSEKVRNADIDAFQSNTRRIMIANLAAGNAGVSLHDLIGGAARHSIVSPSFSAIHLVQALGRIHRAEGKTACIQKVLFAADTIEEQACRRVQAKINNIDQLNDGDLTSGINLI
jgi:SNF2 family DNA or RNA helicase